MQELMVPFRGKNYFYTRSFKPNLTSNLIAEASDNLDLEGKDILDLGCGCGALGLSLIKHSPRSIDLSDVSSGAIYDCDLNIKNLKSNLSSTKLKTIQSDCFNDFKNNKTYDIIINDVSGISEEISKLSPWFLNAPCNSGSDGLGLFKKIIIEASNFLKPNGVLLTPLLSLSNINNARIFLNNLLNEYKILKKKEWFLPDEMTKKFKKEIENQLKIGNINLEYKFGKFIAWTEILIFKKEFYK